MRALLSGPWVIVAALAFAQTAAAEPSHPALPKALERGHFIYGTDLEGGGPYIYPDPKDPQRLIGFEVELADAMARSLSQHFGRDLGARRFEGAWDQLPNLLQTGRIDVVLNGYEYSDERAQVMVASDPYYIYRLQLLARKDDGRITSLASIGAASGMKIGVLAGSAAEKLAVDRWGKNIELSLYDGNTNAMHDVEGGRLDATIQDLPIAVFYAKDYPGLRFVDAPVAPGSYVMFLRKGDEALAAALNDSIASLQKSGELRQIYERYGLWTEDQEVLGKPNEAAAKNPASATGPSGPDAIDTLDDSTKPGFWARHGTTLLQAAGMTILLSVTAMPLAILLGMLIALGRMYGPPMLRRALTFYVEVLRGTPLLLQLLVIFYLLPHLGLTLPAVVAAVMGLAINYSAYEAEIYRAGLQAVPVGQLEAALTLGMKKSMAIRRIVLPQAARIVIPPVTNDFIALFKDTSVCSVITVVELSKRYNIAVNNNPAELLPLAAVVGVLYLAMSYPLSLLSGRMEAKLRR